MIISASRRTDIPAFYSEWFINRVKEGFCVTVNPFNRKQKKLVSLRPEDVTAIVFWSKNPAPLMKYLDYLDAMGYRYYFGFTLNNYPSELEPNVPEVKTRINTFKRLSQRLGKKRVIWRYDPIVLSNKTPIDFHIGNFEFLTKELKDYTCKCVFSFLELYPKVQKRINKMHKEYGFAVQDIRSEKHKQILKSLVMQFKSIADSYGLDLRSCAEKMDLTPYGIKPNSCIDGNLINEMPGTNVPFKKDRNQRRECLCIESIDIGMYNTCLNQCVYCYANYSAKTAEANNRAHDKFSPVLIGNLNDIDLSKFKKYHSQRTLF
ncbi:MAG: DUF1848 domain-containing protein [Peptococcaceae bacterium]|nr:DUF1848 domain-containing protein [Peptococcaceae bacterium]